jgi:hypothetical protein
LDQLTAKPAVERNVTTVMPDIATVIGDWAFKIQLCHCDRGCPWRQGGCRNVTSTSGHLKRTPEPAMEAAGRPEDVRRVLLGHEEKTVAAGCGEGFPVPMLRKWIGRLLIGTPVRLSGRLCRLL